MSFLVELFERTCYVGCYMHISFLMLMLLMFVYVPCMLVCVGACVVLDGLISYVLWSFKCVV